MKEIFQYFIRPTDWQKPTDNMQSSLLKTIIYTVSESGVALGVTPSKKGDLGVSPSATLCSAGTNDVMEDSVQGTERWDTIKLHT